MQNIERAVSGLGIKVSTAIDIRGLSGFPPSQETFKPEFRNFSAPIIDFLASKKSPLLVNLYPYFSYINNIRDLRLEYALFASQFTEISDGSNSYRNLFHAILDTAYAALEKTRGGSVEIVVSETGWPTAGGAAASVDNALIYVNNLIHIVKTGSPRRPGRAVETYIYAMFDENQKGSGYEKYWGMFLSNQKPKYVANFESNSGTSVDPPSPAPTNSGTKSPSPAPMGNGTIEPKKTIPVAKQKSSWKIKLIIGTISLDQSM